MPIPSTNLPANVLEKMSKGDRKHLGKAGWTAEECAQKWQRGEESKLQAMVSNYLLLKGIYFEWDPMHRKTSGKVGRPDFRICYHGRFVGIECKAEGCKPSPEQEKQLDAIQASGGFALVAYTLAEVIVGLSLIKTSAEATAITTKTTKGD